MKHLIKVIFILVSFFSILNAQNLPNDAVFEHIGSNHGLSQNDVNCIYQDVYGYMWFGTHDGLNKFDGYEFTVYLPKSNDPKSINSNLIYTIDGDEKGNLWIGTSGDGLNFFDRKTETFCHYTHDSDDKTSISDNNIKSILLDSQKRLWIISNKGIDLGKIKEDKSKLTFKKIDESYNLPAVNYAFEDSKQRIWLGTRQGLFLVHQDTLKENMSFERISIKNVTIRSISESNNKLIVGSNISLYTLNESNDKFQLVKEWSKGDKETITNLLVDKNTLWAGTDDGLLAFDIKPKIRLKKEFKYNPQNRNSINKNIVKALFKDKTGIIWVGTNGGGVNKYDPKRKPFTHVTSTIQPESLSYDKIRSIYEDSHNNLWVGTEGGNLNMLPYQNSNDYIGFKEFTNIKKTFSIEEVEINGKKILLFGGESPYSIKQLDISNPQSIKEIPVIDLPNFGRSVFKILNDSDNNLWFGTYNDGIYRWLYDNTSKTYIKDKLKSSNRDVFSIPNNIIRNILEDRHGNIWFATGDGLAMLPKEEKLNKNPKFKIFKHNPLNKNSISHNYILELFESKNGDIWIGTLGGGLNKLIPTSSDNDKNFESYLREDGLPNNVIKGILEDDSGNLWISTNKGISKFNPKTKVFKNYDANDGLQDNEFQELARLKRKNGDLLFGGVNGFNVFNPSKIKSNPIEGETVITGLSIFNKKIILGDTINNRVLLKTPISQTKHLKLRYKENNFALNFAGLHYSAPNKNNFLYKLEGFDDQWIFANSQKRQATYTNVSPGEYTFKVKASNNDNVWDSSPAEIKITVAPPYYLTGFAFFVYGLLFISCLLLYRRFTIIKTAKKHKLELEHIESEKNEEIQKAKLEFFTNITHEFTTPLTLIQGPLKHLQKKGDTLSNDAILEQYKLMEKNSDYLMRLISQLLDFRKMNQGKMRLVMRNSNIINFIKEVSEPFQFMARKQQMQFIVTSENESRLSWFDHDAVEKIINNLLSNAFKFTPKNGRININISFHNDSETAPNSSFPKYVMVKVSDSGPGMAESKVKSIFERFFSEKNEDRINAKGIGIGLTFTKDLVLLHQGNIRVESKLNEGSTFIVKLPTEKRAYLNIPEITCKDASESDFHVRSSESDSLAISLNDDILDKNLMGSGNDTPILLVVDDNKDIRTFIKQALKDKYIVYTAENGEDAIDILSNISPKIVITDVMMPIMDGIELCKYIKNRKETSHIPVVMLTAKLSQENEILGLKNGADAYIRKPFDIELLELKLSNIIKHREELRNKFNLDITLQPKEITVTSVDERFLNQAIAIVEKHMMNTDFNVEMLVKEIGYSRTNLYKKFKEITGLSSSEFIRNIRLKRAVQLFEQSDLSVKEIMYMTGFNTSSYFAKCFKKQFGVKPSEYVRQQNKSS
ncbi:two-component regulator propeller domain-containing protein [Flavobacteriaceae bacterium MHTCC 0001]